MNKGKAAFSQVVELIPRRAFENAVERYRGDRKATHLPCRQQLLVMLFAQLTMRSSLRELVVCLNAAEPHLYHCGIKGPITKSTLADANNRRDWRIYMDLAMAMIRTDIALEAPDPELEKFVGGPILALDSTTIDLCLKLFPWALFRKAKAGVKLHTLYDVSRQMPVFIHISEAKKHDLKALDLIPITPGALYLADKAYVDFGRLGRIHRAGAFFVTRRKDNMAARVVERMPAKPECGVIYDNLVRLTVPKTRQLYADVLRVIKFKDFETGRTYRFLTNCHTLEPEVIAQLYKRRWQIELFFKWIKQYLHIKDFYGTTFNAVAMQVWVAVIAFILVSRVKRRFALSQTPGEIFQILSVCIFQKTPLSKLFSEKPRKTQQAGDHKQLVLFKI
jgi:hypothetical protein